MAVLLQSKVSEKLCIVKQRQEMVEMYAWPLEYVLLYAHMERIANVVKVNS